MLKPATIAVGLALSSFILAGCLNEKSTQPEYQEPQSSSSEEDPHLSSSSADTIPESPPVPDRCTFSFGSGWFEGATEVDIQGFDHVTLWLGNDEYFNYGWEGEMLFAAHLAGVVPFFYAYVIAEVGKDQTPALSDCDTKKKPNHCTDGARVIREEWAEIMHRYSSYAKGIREYVVDYNQVDPDTLKTVWLIEPDFYQYSVSGDEQETNYAQVGGGIPDAELAAKFHEIVDTIKAYLPAARISIDISPWIADQQAWYANFDLTQVNYAHTSGGRTLAGSEHIRGAEAKWADIHRIVGKPIIADAGYGVAGSSTGHDTRWDNPTNINARIADGVVAVSQQNPGKNYGALIAEIGPQLSRLPGCPVP